jgi:hypothetical protein
VVLGVLGLGKWLEFGISDSFPHPGGGQSRNFGFLARWELRSRTGLLKCGGIWEAKRLQDFWCGEAGARAIGAAPESGVMDEVLGVAGSMVRFEKALGAFPLPASVCGYAFLSSDLRRRH